MSNNVQRQINRKAQRAIEDQLKESRRLQITQMTQRLTALESSMGEVLQALMNTQVNNKPILAIDRKSKGGVLLPIVR